MADITHWLWYTLAARFNPALMHGLYAKVKDIDKIYGFYEKELRENGIHDERFIDALCNKDLTAAERELMYCNAYGIRLITRENKRYPHLASQMFSPPLVLYVRGNHYNPEGEVYVAVVGTRKATRYGLDMARTISRDLGAAGITVVSGMATGIDSAAHIGCMQAGGKTIAVLGGGVNVAYPKENRDLMVQIMNNGCVISENGLEYEFKKGMFPRRNHVMCGLCSGVVVVEAPPESGALISAHLALEEGRDLFAVPGNIGHESSEGANALLRDCAKMVTNAEDIIAEYAHLYPHCIQYKQFTAYNAEFEMAKSLQSTRLTEDVLKLIEHRPLSAERIALQCNISAARANGILTVLMNMGAVAMYGSNMFIKSTALKQ